MLDVMILEVPPAIVWQAPEARRCAVTPRNVWEARHSARHFYGQLALIMADRGWSIGEWTRWSCSFECGSVDDRDLIAASVNGWNHDQTVERKTIGLALIPAVVGGAGWGGSTSAAGSAPFPSCHPCIPPFRILNSGGTLYVGCLAFHKDGVTGVECGVDGGTLVSEATWSYNPSYEGGTWGYWWSLSAADHSGNAAATVRFRATATGGAQTVYGNSDEYPILKNLGATTPDNGYCKRLIRWCAPVSTIPTASDSNAALDPTGSSLTAGTWDATNRILKQTGTTKFSNVSTSAEWSRYVWVNATGGFTAGLYYVETKIGQDAVVLSATPDPAGIALYALPQTNGTSITTANGPRLTIGGAAYRIRLDSSQARSFGGTFHASDSDTGSNRQRGDNGLVYCCPGTYAWERPTGTTSTHCETGNLDVRPAPGLDPTQVTLSGSPAGASGSIRRVSVDGIGLCKARISGPGSGGSLWLANTIIRGSTYAERGLDTLNPAALSVTENAISIAVAAPLASCSFVVTSGLLTVTPNTGSPLAITLNGVKTVQAVMTEINAVSGLTAKLADGSGVYTTATDSDNYGMPCSRLCLRSTSATAGNSATLVWNAPTSSSARYQAADFTSGCWLSGVRFEDTEACLTTDAIAINCTAFNQGSDFISMARFVLNCAVRDVHKGDFGHYGNHTDGIQYSPGAGIANHILCNIRAFNCKVQPLYSEPAATVTNLHVVNYLCVQETDEEYSAQIGASAGSFAHLLFLHWTLPNSRLLVHAMTGAGAYTHSAIRYTVQAYIRNSATAAPSGMTIEHGHSYDTDNEEDSGLFTGWTTGDPEFVAGAFGRDFDLDSLNYRPDASSPLLARAPVPPVYPVDILQVQRPTAASCAIGAVEPEAVIVPPSPPASTRRGFRTRAKIG